MVSISRMSKSGPRRSTRAGRPSMRNIRWSSSSSGTDEDFSPSSGYSSHGTPVSSRGSSRSSRGSSRGSRGSSGSRGRKASTASKARASRGSSRSPKKVTGKPSMSWTKPQLVAYAKARGKPSSGTKADILKNL